MHYHANLLLPFVVILTVKVKIVVKRRWDVGQPGT